MHITEILDRLHSIDRENHLLERSIAALQWDQETNLPVKGVEYRACQLALLESIAHSQLTAPQTGSLLAEIGSSGENPGGDESLSSFERDFLRIIRRKYDRAILLPPDFVKSAARSEGLSQAAWARARQDNDYKAFLPHLKKMINIARKKAAYWRPLSSKKGASLYDVLLDFYEPFSPGHEMGEAETGRLFSVLQGKLSELLKKIYLSSPPDTYFLKENYSAVKQAAFNEKLLDYLGFNRQRGRMDKSAHPFTTTLGPNDVRITTRYFEDNLLSGIFSVIHEAGHAFYEMGFPSELSGSCLADGASMAIHESQSRFWENVIGRSLPFWEGLFPLLREFFPKQLAGVNTVQFYRTVNDVKPGLIRVDADELSYCQHIIFRFELEQQLISGSLDPEELPAAWNKKVKEYIDLEVDSDANGVLQDIHWAMGAFGYFPSYLLGSLYSLQFAEKLNSDIPELPDFVTAGKFECIREWLCDNIYRHGCRLPPAQLLKKVTGEMPGIDAFVRYAEAKYGELYSSH